MPGTSWAIPLSSPHASHQLLVLQPRHPKKILVTEALPRPSCGIPEGISSGNSRLIKKDSSLGSHCSYQTTSHTHLGIKAPFRPVGSVGSFANSGMPSAKTTKTATPAVFNPLTKPSVPSFGLVKAMKSPPSLAQLPGKFATPWNLQGKVS